MPTSRKKTGRSLSQFVKDKKRESCVVCALPDEIRAEIINARTKKIPRPTVLEWLRSECKIKITSADFDRHHSAKHEREE